MTIVDRMYIRFCEKLGQLIKKDDEIEIFHFASTVRKWEDFHGLKTFFNNHWYEVYHDAYKEWLIEGLK